MEQFTAVMLFATIILAGLTLAVVQALKTSFKIKKNLIPLVAILVGLILGALAAPFTDLDLVSRCWAGLIAGLASVGLYETANKRQGYTKSSKK